MQYWDVSVAMGLYSWLNIGLITEIMLFSFSAAIFCKIPLNKFWIIYGYQWFYMYVE